MRRAFLGVVLIALGAMACGSDAVAPAPPGPPGPPVRLTVFVYWRVGVPDKRVEILEAHLEGRTDADGLVHFDVAPGDYTVRVHDIGVPGPPLPWEDFQVHIEAGRPARLPVLDCQPCV